MVNVEPWPGTLCTLTVPRWFVTMATIVAATAAFTVLVSNGLELLQARQRRREAKAARGAAAASTCPRRGERAAESRPTKVARPPRPSVPRPRPQHLFDTDWLGFN